MFKRMSSEIRWAFNSQAWQPTAVEWSYMLGCIQKEEQERIQKFMFRRDAKSSLIGQIMIRKVTSEALQVPYTEVLLSRTETGKPFVKNPEKSHIEFNVSHQGLYTVLAATHTGPIGVDIMQIDLKRFQNDSYKVNSFFHTMRSQFTPAEWRNIRQGDIPQQLANFYRHWSLKESYVKATGTGIGFDLQRIEFEVKETLTSNGVNSTKVKVDGQTNERWYFEEFLLDDKHCVAVASTSSKSGPPESFQILAVDHLMTNVRPLTPVDDKNGELFVQKEEQPNLCYTV